MEIRNSYFKPEHKLRLDKSRNFSEASLVALDILNQMPKPIGEVCGPITSGGRSSIEENLDIFEKTIFKLQSQGKIIFNQLVFESNLEKFWKRDIGTLEERNRKLLSEFYEPIFRSGFVKDLYFIYGWEDSKGSTWEHKLSYDLGLNRIYLPQNFLNQ